MMYQPSVSTGATNCSLNLKSSLPASFTRLVVMVVVVVVAVVVIVVVVVVVVLLLL